MGKNSEIAWTDHTFNPWIGCQRVSPGCEHCYAEAFVATRLRLPVWGAKAERRITSDANWRQPLKWDREARLDAEHTGARPRVFCASLADVFEDRPELVAPRARLWRLIGETPSLDWLLLTKRPENAARLAYTAGLHAWDGGGPDAPTWPANVWLGTTAEDQRRADERIPHLLATDGPAVRFVSAEPLLGPLRLDDYTDRRSGRRAVDWVIVGGESGAGARPMDLSWARRVVDGCRTDRCAVFVKQLGKSPRMRDGEPWRLKHPKGGNPEEWPPGLYVRQFPEARP